MHYFKDKKGELTSVEDIYWESVKKLEPWLKECDSRGNELGKPLTNMKVENKPFQANPIQETATIKQVTQPVKPLNVNELEKLKEEKLKSSTKVEPDDDIAKSKPKTNAKSTGTKRKRTSKKA